jgi:hypothetical protein
MNATIEMTPVQWSKLLPFDEVEPVNEGDLECLSEVREILKKHGKRDRFGVALLHKHFELEAGEVLVETTDEVARVQMIKPVQKESITGTVGTIWMLLDGQNKEMLGCRRQCSLDVQGNHNSFHSIT